MVKCVRCNLDLYKSDLDGLSILSCDSCEGRFVSYDSLIGSSIENYIKELWDISTSGNCNERIACPSCSNLMKEVVVQQANQILTIDCCHRCRKFWFDRREFDRIANETSFSRGRVGIYSESKKDLLNLIDRPKARFIPFHYDEKVNDINVDAVEEEDYFSQFKMLLTYLGVPFESRESKSLPTAYIVRILTLIVGAISFLGFQDNSLFKDFGFVPSNPLQHYGLTIFTVFFLHGGIAHLLGNMYFFNVFGDDVEAYLGRVMFFVLLIFCSLGSVGLIYALDSGSSIPTIGASGVISGILAFYARAFPYRQIGFKNFYTSLSVNSYAVFFYWIIMQFWMFLGDKGMGGVSYSGHLGGAICGWIFYEGLDHFHFMDGKKS